MNKKIWVPLVRHDRAEEMIPYIENVARVMAKQLIGPLGADSGTQEILPSLKPAVESGVKTKLWRMISMLSRYVHRQDRRQLGDRYISRKSHEEECRREFLKFLHW